MAQIIHTIVCGSFLKKKEQCIGTPPAPDRTTTPLLYDRIEQFCEFLSRKIFRNIFVGAV